MGTFPRAVPLFFVFLTSCATEPQTSALEESTAKRAWIVKFYAPDSPPKAYSECLAHLSPDESQGVRPVEVKYSHLRKMFYVTAALPDSIQANVHDEVELQSENCAQGTIYRIARIMHSD